jgi:hypothetical protein
MGLVNLVVSHRRELDLRPLLHWLARERSWVRTHGSVSRHAVDCVGSPFSQEQCDLSKSVGVPRKVATYGDRPQEAYAGHTWTGMGSVHVVLVGFPLQGVHRFELPQLSDMSNYLFVAVITYLT